MTIETRLGGALALSLGASLLFLMGNKNISFESTRGHSLVHSRLLESSNEASTDGILGTKAVAPRLNIDVDRNVCTRNPFLESTDESEGRLKTRFDALVKVTAWDREQITMDPQRKHDHKRFRVFHPAVHCDATCVGGDCESDTSKVVCGLETLHDDPCVVYSIGGNNQWEFELDMLQKTSCEIHTFDCTGEESRFVKPESDRLFFHYECLGTSSVQKFFTLDQLAEKNGHKQIDILKMDIEGYEFDIFESMFSSEGSTSLPMQILAQVHYKTDHESLGGIINGLEVDSWKQEIDLFNLNLSLLKAGYIVANRDDHGSCRHCSELTLLRAMC